MKYLIKFFIISLLFGTAWSGPALANDFSAKGGDVIGRHIFGLVVDEHGDPLIQDDQSLIYARSNFDLRLTKEGHVFILSGFNQGVGQLYMTEWQAVTSEPIDTWPLSVANIAGVSKPTAAIVTAWNSVFLSESELIDARHPASFIDHFNAYFKGDRSRVKPYNYGWLDEVILLDDSGAAKVIKNYAMGRVFASQLLMMPDNKTVYMVDAEHSGNLYMFIADQAGSLSKGTLYSLAQDSAGMKYFKLGSSSALKMKFKLKKVSFSSLFDSSDPVQGHCTAGFKHLLTVYGEECLKIKSKLRRYAGLFEPLRVLAMQGGKQSGRSFVAMSLDENESRLSLHDKTGKTQVFDLGSGMNSNYVIKESL